MSLFEGPNGTCSPGDTCQMLKLALGTSDEKTKTGLVQNLMPPHHVAIRCKGARRGEYRNLILRLCPFCGADLPQGKTEIG